MRTPTECAAFMVYKYKGRTKAIDWVKKYAMTAGMNGNSWAWNYWQSVLNELEKIETVHE